MCKSLCTVYIKVLAIFPELEAARPRSTSGIQALCALHIALEKTKNILQHCAECSKLYLVRMLLVTCFDLAFMQKVRFSIIRSEIVVGSSHHLVSPYGGMKVMKSKSFLSSITVMRILYYSISLINFLDLKKLTCSWILWSIIAF